jgi:hypothetical protein
MARVGPSPIARSGLRVRIAEVTSPYGPERLAKIVEAHVADAGCSQRPRLRDASGRQPGDPSTSRGQWKLGPARHVAGAVARTTRDDSGGLGPSPRKGGQPRRHMTYRFTRRRAGHRDGLERTAGEDSPGRRCSHHEKGSDRRGQRPDRPWCAHRSSQCSTRSRPTVPVAAIFTAAVTSAPCAVRARWARPCLDHRRRVAAHSGSLVASATNVDDRSVAIDAYRAVRARRPSQADRARRGLGAFTGTRGLAILPFSRLRPRVGFRRPRRALVTQRGLDAGGPPLGPAAHGG